MIIQVSKPFRPQTSMGKILSTENSADPLQTPWIILNTYFRGAIENIVGGGGEEGGVGDGKEFFRVWNYATQRKTKTKFLSESRLQL